MKKLKVGDRVALKGTVIDHHGDYVVARMDGFYGTVQYKYRMSVAEEPYWIKLRPKNKPFFKSDLPKGDPTSAFNEIEQYIKNGSE